MHYFAKHSLRCLLLVLLLAGMSAACADGIQVKSAALRLTDEGYALDADFEINITPTLDEALHKGVALYFVTEFDLSRSRWYWPDEKIISAQRQTKLTYNVLTKQYRVGFDTLFQNFSTLNEALGVLSRWREHRLADKDAFKRQGTYATVLRYLDKGLLWDKDATYNATLRMWLDVSQLPKPFQVNALATGDWSLDSELFRWSVAP